MVINGDEWQKKITPHQFMNSSSHDSPMDPQKAAEDLGLWIHPLSARRFSRISRRISTGGFARSQMVMDWIWVYDIG